MIPRAFYAGHQAWLFGESSVVLRAGHFNEVEAQKSPDETYSRMAGGKLETAGFKTLLDK